VTSEDWLVLLLLAGAGLVTVLLMYRVIALIGRAIMLICRVVALTCYWIITFTYKAIKVMYMNSVYRVPPGKFGVQTRRFGRRRPDEPSSRVSVFGGPGPQAQVLKGNAYYLLPPFLYEVKCVDQIYIKPNTIGLVLAKAGKVADSGARLAPFVECDHFQDGAAFLRNGGCQGLQMQVLTTGHYDINPHIFDVITIDNVSAYPTLELGPQDLRQVTIEVGETGVAITHLGQTGNLDEDDVAPLVSGHDSFQFPWAFLANGGQLGVQSQTLSAGGHYTINPLFAHVVKIPTKELVLEWSKVSKKETNLDVSLAQIDLDVQGYHVRLNMKQTLRIPKQTAPGLVCRYGDQGRLGQSGRTPVQQFVEKVLATIVNAYFLRIAARCTILEFITKYDEIGVELDREVSRALAGHGVEARITALEDFDCEPDDMNVLRRNIALERHRLNVLEASLANTRVEADIEMLKVQVESSRRKLELVTIQGLVELLGPQQVAMERVLAEWSKMGVPQTLAVGGSDDVASSILQAMPFSQARDMLLAMATESGRQLANASNGRPKAVDPAGEDDED
jgi:hypothetical protein